MSMLNVLNYKLNILSEILADERTAEMRFFFVQHQGRHIITPRLRRPQRGYEWAEPNEKPKQKQASIHQSFEP